MPRRRDNNYERSRQRRQSIKKFQDTIIELKKVIRKQDQIFNERIRKLENLLVEYENTTKELDEKVRRSKENEKKAEALNNEITYELTQLKKTYDLLHD